MKIIEKIKQDYYEYCWDWSDDYEDEEAAPSFGEYVKHKIGTGFYNLKTKLFGKPHKDHGFTFESEFTNSFENVDYSEFNIDDVEIII